MNLFVIYKRTLEEAGSKPVSHYEYQKAVALAWIDPDKFGSDVGYNTPTDNKESLSTISRSAGGEHGSVDSATGKRKIYLTNRSLDPQKGSLCHRLNRQNHWPSLPPRDQSGQVTTCNLHRWACGAKCQKHAFVAYCEECNVVLCTDQCFRIFHEVWDLPAEKENVRYQLQAQGQNEKT